MSAPLTPSEQFTHDLCTQSFLAPWCYNNPIGKKGKELCDVLGVCDPDIVVFSVKDVGLADEDNHVHRKRWLREAVDASLRQLYGASKWLQSASHVIRNDGTQGLPLPPHGHRRIHRVAVAFGSRGKCSISSGDFGKGHVHVLTEQTLIDVLTELDTTTDFIHYLTAKEDFLTNNGGIVINGSEADLLGFYIHAGRAIPEKAGLLMIEPGIWDTLRTKPEFIARKAEDRDSYTWDDLIDDLAGHDHRGLGLELADRELVIRELARENRFGRRLREHFGINRKRAQRLMRLLGLEAVYAKRSTSRPAPGHKIYPYLLRNLAITRPDQVWASDITYIPLQHGFLYLTAVMDLYSRNVLSWRLSNTLTGDFCIAALNAALAKARPEIFNTDQGAQFTATAFTSRLKESGVAISMDGRGRALDNVFVERLWRTVKYEEVYLRDYVDGWQAEKLLGKYFDFYRHERPHQALGYRTPSDVYAEG